MIFTLVEIDQISDCVEFLNCMYWIPIYMQRQDFQQNSNKTHKDLGTVAHSCHPLYYGFTHCYITLVENTVALIDMCFSLEIGEYENDLLIIRNLELQDQFFLI